MSDKVDIINHIWHVAHQHELLKLSNTQWHWLRQPRRNYSTFPRGEIAQKYGVEWVTHHEKDKYDMALLHLDQQCFRDDLWERGKGSLFKELNRQITDVPKALIMHGTPYYPKYFNERTITEDNYEDWGYTEDQIDMSAELIDRFHERTKDIDAFVFNSYEARRQWGMEDRNNAYAMWHGMDAEEWVDLPKEPRVVTFISPAGLDMYYDRSFLRGVRDVLDEKDINHCHIGTDNNFDSFEEYREFLGRSLLYFNPTRESPMPRSRSEAMWSGACVLTTPHQDADEFIENGENGIIVPRDPETVAEIIESLLLDYEKAVKIGQKGKETAKEVFSAERFRDDWQTIISDLLN